MEPKLKSSCFAYSAISRSKMDLYSLPQMMSSNSYDVELDAALNELHMLSTTPNSRIEYLREKGCSNMQVNKKTPSNSPSLPLCVVQMNSDFVTKFSVSKDSLSIPDGSLSDDSPKTDLVLKAKRNHTSNRGRYNMLTPYGRHERVGSSSSCRQRRKRLRDVTPIESSLSDFTEERSSLLIVPHQDCGNKSNPSSPVKNQNSSKSVACSIFRSRSLDDLEISKLNLEDNGVQSCHGDIDTVSQRISKLHVN